MEHPVEAMARERVHHHRVIADVAADDLDLAAQASEVVFLHCRIVVVVEIIEDHDLIFGGDQGFTKMRADEPCTTGDEKLLWRNMNAQEIENTRVPNLWQS